MCLCVNNKCRKCGGKIVAEAIGNYGTVFYVRKDGTIGRKLREIKYEHSGDWMYSVQNVVKIMKKKILQMLSNYLTNW